MEKFHVTLRDPPTIVLASSVAERNRQTARLRQMIGRQDWPENQDMPLLPAYEVLRPGISA